MMYQTHEPAAGKDSHPIGENRARRARPFRSAQQAARRWHYGDLVHRKRHDTSTTDGKTSTPLKHGAPADEIGHRYPKYGEKGWRAGRGTAWLANRTEQAVERLTSKYPEASVYLTGARFDRVRSKGLRDYDSARRTIFGMKEIRKGASRMTYAQHLDRVLIKFASFEPVSVVAADEITTKGLGFSDDKSRAPESSAPPPPAAPPKPPTPVPVEVRPKTPPPVPAPPVSPDAHCWHFRVSGGATKCGMYSLPGPYSMTGCDATCRSVGPPSKRRLVVSKPCVALPARCVGCSGEYPEVWRGRVVDAT